MSGRPFRREVHRRIQAAGGFAVMYERIASGETVTSIARELGCSQQFLSSILTQSESRKALYDIARRESATAHAERGLEIIDEKLPKGATNADVQHRKERANYRRWLASKLDRDTFGDTPLVQVNNNPTQVFAQQYLEALRAPVPSGPALPPVKEAEILEVTDGVEARQIEGHVARPADQDQREPVGVPLAGGAEVVPLQTELWRAEGGER